MVENTKQPMSKETFWGLLGIACFIVAWVFPMKWWFQLLLLTTFAGIIISLVDRSRWTVKWRWYLKGIVSLTALSLLVIVSWNPVKDQWTKDHPVKQTKEISPSAIKPPEKPIVTIPEKQKPTKPIKPTEKKETKEIETAPNIKPKLNIDIFSLPPFGGKLQRYRVFITNNNLQSASIVDFRIEFRFKESLAEIEQWPGLMTGNIGMGRFEIHGKRQDGSEFTQINRPPHA